MQLGALTNNSQNFTPNNSESHSVSHHYSQRQRECANCRAAGRTHLVYPCWYVISRDDGEGDCFSVVFGHTASASRRDCSSLRTVSASRDTKKEFSKDIDLQNTARFSCSGLAVGNGKALFRTFAPSQKLPDYDYQIPQASIRHYAAVAKAVWLVARLRHWYRARQHRSPCEYGVQQPWQRRRAHYEDTENVAQEVIRFRHVDDFAHGNEGEDCHHYSKARHRSKE